MHFLKFLKFPAPKILAKNFWSYKFLKNMLWGVFWAWESDFELNLPQKPRPNPTFAYRLSAFPAKSAGTLSETRFSTHPNPIVVWENRLLHPQKHYKISISEPPDPPKPPNQKPRLPRVYIL